MKNTNNEDTDRIQADSSINNGQQNMDEYNMLYGGDKEEPPRKEEIHNGFDESKNAGNTKKIITALAITTAVAVALAFTIRMLRSQPVPPEPSTSALQPFSEMQSIQTQDQTEVLNRTAHVYFDANGGIAEFTEKTAAIGDGYGLLPKAAREGYVFGGWFTEREGGEPVSPERIIFKDNETAYAHWVESTGNAEPVGAAGTSVLVTEKSIETVKQTTVKPSAKPVTTTKPKTTAKPQTTAKPKSATTTRKVAYTLSYSANGGSGAPSSQSGSNRYTISFTEPRRNGYAFLGWSESPSAAAPSYFGGDIVTISKNITLYAVWVKSTYTLSYNANGGSGAPSSQSGGTRYTIPNREPVRSGFEFLGWSQNPSASSPSYGGGDILTLSGNVTLYAVWRRAAYTLYYSANGGSGAPSSQSGSTKYTISYTEPVRTGYTFIGWSTNPSASTASYSGGDSVTLSDNVTLYAVWKQKNNYTVSFNANGGICSTSYKTVEAGGTVSMPTATRDGYKFTGWWTSPNGGTQFTSSTKITSNVDLFAHWESLESTLRVSSFKTNVTWENGTPIVAIDCYIESNYKITDYTITNDKNNARTYIGPNSAGKIYKAHPNTSVPIRGGSAGETVKFTVTASDTSGKTITNDYYVLL